MEERTIELIAKGHSIGDLLELRVDTGKDLSIGSPAEIIIQVSGDEGSRKYELTLSDVEGFDPETISLIPIGEEAEGSGVTLNAAPTGKPGPSLLRIVVKGDLYSATLAIQEVDLNIRPPSLHAELMDGPIELSAGERSLIPVKLTMPGHSRIKGDVTLDLLNPNGKVVDIEGGGPKHLSFRDFKTVEFNIIPGLVHPGSYSLRIKVKEKDRTISKILTDTVEIIHDVEQEIIDAPKPPGDSEVSGIRIVTFKFDPLEISPGSETDLVLEIQRSEAFKVPLDLSLSFGKRKIKDLKIDEGSEQIRERIKVPIDLRSGEMTAVLKISSPDEVLIREVKPRALTIKGTSRLDIRIASPADLLSQERKSNEEYLFPGEFVRNIRRSGSIEIWNLSSGRFLYIHEGRVVHGKAWKDDLSDEVLTRILSIEVAERFLDPELHRKLRREIEEATRIGLLSILEQNEKITEQELMDDLVKDHVNGTGGLIAEAVIKRSSGRNRQIMTRSKMMDLHMDPVPSIVNDIGMLLSINDDEHDLKDHYENTIREFRSMKEGPSRMATITAHAVCMTGIKSAMDKLLQEIEITDGITELIFYLILSSLIRIECFTTWTDPAIGSWDELRIERQRMLKKEISSLFDLIDDLAKITRTIRRRFHSYKSNMKVRRELALVSKIDMGPSDWSLEGDGGEVWSGKRTIQMEPFAEGMEIITSIKLPGLSWNLVSPPSERDGSLFILPVQKVPSKGRYDLELEIASPGTPPSSQEALVYLMPKEFRLEVEE